MLILNAEIFGAMGAGLVDVRVTDDCVARIGSLTPEPGEALLDAAGCVLLPGLHDHHIHLLSYAASLGSALCGPPGITNESDLIEALLEQDATRTGSDWLRGYGYHESVAGEINRDWLDRHLPHRPTRIQHRSGRLWVLNSAAMDTITERLKAAAAYTLDLPADGRLFDQDEALGAILGHELPPVERASQQLADFGVTGFTDMTPLNDAERLALFAELRRSGAIRQSVHLAGAASLPYPFSDGGVSTSATKIHLHEAALPTFEELRDRVRNSHDRRRPVAVHCVTEVELVFTLAAIEEAGPLAGDRIEHASVTPPRLLETIAELALTVVTQPNFIQERGDAYLNDIPAAEIPWLYRAGRFLQAGIPLAGGTDAPFGHADPWAAMHAAVQRRTAGGRLLGEAEALSAEAAVELFLGDADRPSQPRRISEGARADLCLLNQPWALARGDLSSSLVRATLCAGHAVSGSEHIRAQP